MDSLNMTPVRQDEISLAELLDVVRRWKWSILSFALVCTFAVGIVAGLMPKTYKAVIVISPVTDDARGAQLGGLGSLISEFGGLASLAGLSMRSDTKRAESLTVLQSEALTERYIEQNNLLPILFESKWDAQKQAWNETDPRKIPTLWKANEYFKKKVRSITTDSKTGIVTLGIAWKDADVAAKWANELVAITNDYLRRKAIDESQRNIAYLNQQAAKTDVVQAKQAIYAILQTEINREMLARGSDEYAFKILDPARPPERPSSPKPVLWIAIAFFGSLLLALLAAFARVVWSRA